MRGRITAFQLKPESRLRLLREALLPLAALALCPAAAQLVPQTTATALAHAHGLRELELALGLFPEAAASDWLADRGWLAGPVAAVYMLAHLPVTAAVLGWVALRRRAAWPVVRTSFVAAQCLTIAANLAWPCAPPSRVGVADVTASVWGERALEGAHALQSPVAAMPSGHVVFATVAGGALAWLSPSPWLRAAGLAWPMSVVAITIASGNHFWLDAVGAFLVVALAWGLALSPRVLRRATPKGTRVGIPRPLGSGR